MANLPRRTLVTLAVLMSATLAALDAASVPRTATPRSPGDASGGDVVPAADDGADKNPKRKNLLIIGASSLISPLGQPQLVRALLESKGTPMNVEGKIFGTEPVDRMLSSRQACDYVIMDAWQFRRGRTDPHEFPDAVVVFAKQVRVHSPDCKIILFPW